MRRWREQRRNKGTSGWLTRSAVPSNGTSWTSGPGSVACSARSGSPNCEPISRPLDRSMRHVISWADCDDKFGGGHLGNKPGWAVPASRSAVKNRGHAPHTQANGPGCRHCCGACVTLSSPTGSRHGYILSENEKGQTECTTQALFLRRILTTMQRASSWV